MDSTLGHAAFTATATPSLFLDTDMVIRGANPAYLQAVGRSMDELEGRHVFTAFPTSSDSESEEGRVALENCLRRVLAGKGPDHLALQRYDVASLDTPERFAERYWSIVCSPIKDIEGQLAGALLQVHDVTEFRERLLRVLAAGDRAPGLNGRPGATQKVALPAAAAVSLMDAFHRQQELRKENEQLQHALTARAEIDQAIGLVLAEHPGTPQEAFQRLVDLSQKTNVKLRDVARALVERAAEAERPLLP